MQNPNSSLQTIKTGLILLMGVICLLLTLGLRSCVHYAIKLGAGIGPHSRGLSDHDKQSLLIANGILIAGLLVFAVSCFLAWKWNSNPKPGHCLECGYDLRDLPLKPDARCPECGKITADEIK